MADTLDLLRETRQSLLDCVDDIMIALPEEKDLILFKVFIEASLPMKDTIKYITKNIVPMESKVEARDDEYFKTHAILFEGLGQYKTEVNRFKMLWERAENEQDKEMVWSWLEHFIDLGKRYSELTTKNKNQQQKNQKSNH